MEFDALSTVWKQKPAAFGRTALLPEWSVVYSDFAIDEHSDSPTLDSGGLR